MVVIRRTARGRCARATGTGRGFLVTLVILALLAQNGLALLYPRMAAAAFGAVAASPAHHAMAMPADHHGAKGEADGKAEGPAHKPACPVCQALQHGVLGLAAPELSAAATSAPEATAPTTPIRSPDRGNPAFSVPQPRAPPKAA